MSGENVRALAVTVANIRQGRSSTPRCEPPGEADIKIAEQAVKDVLRAIDLSSAPSPAGDDVGRLLGIASAMQIGPSNEGHRIAIYFDDHAVAGKLFAALSDTSPTEGEAGKP